MRRGLAMAVGLLLALRAGAQHFTWQPGPGLQQVAIWPGAAPDEEPVKGPEYAESSGKNLIGGKPAIAIHNVSRPTMTVYPPKGSNTGAAVVVFPGGGYQILAIDLEGSEACDWLTAKGITCVLLKYRVTETGPYPQSGPYPESSVALDDAQRTMGLVRLHAAEWHVDPHKVGVLGFSAGGHLAVAVSVYCGKRKYAPVDAADALSCRPDFAVPIYPGHLNLAAAEWDASRGVAKRSVPVRPGADRDLTLSPEIHVTHDVAPTFLLQNEDDHVDSVYDSLSYFVALQRAGVPAELHVYAQGGHAFGLRRTKLATTEWPALVDRWLVSLGVVPAR
jgi:acetyl esterase/lipase